MWQVLVWILVTLLLTLFLLLLAVITLYLKTQRFQSMVKKIPGPKGYPIIGNALLLNFDNTGALPFLTRLNAEYGPIVRIYGMLTAHVFVTDLKIIEKVLSSTRYIKKSTDYHFLEPWLQEGLLTSTGMKWHTRRKILTPTFHFKILEDYLPVFNKNSTTLVKKLRENMHKPFIEINNFVTLCTLDIICETAMGTTIDAQNGKEVEYVKAVHRMSELFQLRQLKLWLYNDIVFKFSPLGREQAKVLNILHSFTNKIIKQRRAEYRYRKSDAAYAEERGSKRRYLAFLDMLLDISENEHELTDKDIQEEVDTFMFEGHDTTSSALSWVIYLLGSHPEIQDRAFEELNDIFGESDRQPTYEDLARMKYLEQVIKETLRLYPSVPGFSRELQEDTELEGYIVPAGANITTLPVLLQRNPDLYPDPHKFDPDRFSPEGMQNRHPYAFIPFSAGPRSCIGQRFALMEEKAVLSTVLRNFRIESVDQIQDITLLIELILRPKDPLRIRLSPRYNKA